MAIARADFPGRTAFGGKTVNRNIAKRFDRARLYLERIRTAMQTRDPAQGMVNAAELGYQAGAIYAEFAKICKANKPDKNEDRN
jgi:hypothetical protein